MKVWTGGYVIFHKPPAMSRKDVPADWGEFADLVKIHVMGHS
jgi:hypothetical protein